MATQSATDLVRSKVGLSHQIQANTRRETLHLELEALNGPTASVRPRQTSSNQKSGQTSFSHLKSRLSRRKSLHKSPSRLANRTVGWARCSGSFHFPLVMFTVMLVK
jgi:hypothetical protein